MVILKMATNKLQQLINITGTDEETAENLLGACDGNLQLATDMYLESSGNALPAREPQTEGETSAASTSTSSVNREENDDDNVRAPIPQQRGILVMDPYHAVPLPKSTKRKNPTSVFDSFRDFQAEAKKQEELLKSGSTVESCKARTLQDLFRPPVDITFKGTFEMAKSAGAEQQKWLLVNIQNVTEFTCQTLNRDVWSNDVVRAILNEHFLLWQVYCDSDEGQRYMLYYTVKKYPHIAVIDPRTGECMSVWEKSEGIDAQKFCDLATQFVSSHNDLTQKQQCNDETVAIEPCKKKARQNSIVDASEDSQLAAAIAASLSDGDSKSKVVINDADSSNDESDASLQEFSADESEKDSCVGNSLTRKNKDKVDSPNKNFTLPVERNSPEGNEMKSDNKILKETDHMASIAMRFPNGTRCQEKLNKLATIQELSAYVSSKGYSMDRHEIMMTFPRRNLNDLDRTLTLKEAGFGNQETLFLQEK